MIVRLKVEGLNIPNNLKANFNSMIVRLKDQRIAFYYGSQRFQFYDSPIKRAEPFKRESVRGDFNSMIVRLKAVRNDKKHY